MQSGHIPGLHLRRWRRFTDSEQHLPNRNAYPADDTWIEGFCQLINSDCDPALGGNPDQQSATSGNATPAASAVSEQASDVAAGSLADSVGTEAWSLSDAPDAEQQHPAATEYPSFWGWPLSRARAQTL
jgi:hypothetical protein